MTDELQQRARRARAEVHERARALDPDRSLDRVVRRGSRPRTSSVLALALLAVVAVPAAAWLLRTGGPTVELSDEPQPSAPPADAAPTQAPGPGPTTQPTAGVEPSAPEPPPTAGAGTPAPEATPTPTGDPGPTVAPLGEFGTGAVASDDFPGGSSEVALLTDVRVAGQPGFDRIVLEFRGEQRPTFRVAYADPPIIADGSGEPVEIDGSAFLELRLTPASGVDMTSLSGDAYELTYEGPERVTGDTGAVTEIVRTGDFEANLAWVAGLPAEAPFAVTWLSDPLRLVVDIEAP